MPFLLLSLFIHFSILLSIFLSFHLSIFLSIYLSIYLSFQLWIYLSIYVYLPGYELDLLNIIKRWYIILLLLLYSEMIWPPPTPLTPSPPLPSLSSPHHLLSFPPPLHLPIIQHKYTNIHTWCSKIFTFQIPSLALKSFVMNFNCEHKADEYSQGLLAEHLLTTNGCQVLERESHENIFWKKNTFFVTPCAYCGGGHG